MIDWKIFALYINDGKKYELENFASLYFTEKLNNPPTKKGLIHIFSISKNFDVWKLVSRNF